MALAQLNVTLGLQIQSFQKSLNRLERDINRFQRRFETIGTNLTQSISLPLAALAGSAVTAFGEFESLERAFAAVAAEGTNVSEEIERLRKIAQAPGLGFSQAVQASTRLQAVGLSAGQAARVVEQFGNAVARSGGGAESLDGAVLALTQIASKGKISAEEINQLSERIFEIRPALEAAFGTADSEQLQKLGISAEEFIAKVTEELAKLERVDGGLANSFENLRDAARQAFTDIGREISKTIGLPGVLDRIGEALGRAATFFKNLSPEAKRLAINIGLIAIAAGPVLIIIAKLASVFTLATQGLKILIGGVKSLGAAFVFLTTPAGITVAAILAIIAAVGFLYSEFEGVRKIINGVSDAIVALGGVAKSVVGNIVDGFRNLFKKDFSAASENFKKAFSESLIFNTAKVAGDAFDKGFTDGSNRVKTKIDEIRAKIKQLATPAAGAGGAGAGTTAFDLGGFERAQGDGAGAALDPALSKAQQLKDTFDNALTKFINSIKTVSSGRVGLLDLGLSTPIINEQKDALLEYEKSLKLINETAAVFGTNPLEETLRATEAALKAAIAQFGPASEAVRILREEYDKLKVTTNEVVDTFNKAITGAINESLNSLTFSFGEFFGQLAAGSTTLRNFAVSLLGGVADALIQFGKLAIAAGIAAEGIKRALQTLNPVAAIAGGVALVALGTFVKSQSAKLTKLAKGGLAFGPTLAVVGDNPAARTDPEVIAPLSRLRDMLGGSMGGGFVAEARISGSDLALLVSRANLRNERIR
jgi:tape measure domain-containing protein